MSVNLWVGVFIILVPTVTVLVLEVATRIVLFIGDQKFAASPSGEASDRPERLSNGSVEG